MKINTNSQSVLKQKCITQTNFTEEINLVCGCNGKLYKNKCAAIIYGCTNNTNVIDVYQSINQSYICPNGTTIKNITDNNNVYCSNEYNPVCGCDDNITYSNSCFATYVGCNKSWYYGICIL